MKRRLIIALLVLIAVNLFGINKNRYSVERIILGSADNPGITNTVRFKVTNADQGLVYALDIPVDYDLPYPEGYVFEDASLAVVWSYDASVDFYDAEGHTVKKHFILGENNIEYERSLMAAADGETLVLALSDANFTGSKIQIINSSTKLLGEWNSEYKNITGIAFENDRKIIALSGYNFNGNNFEFSSSFLSSDGQLLGVVENSFRKGKFDVSGVFTAHDNRKAFIVTLNSYEIIEKFNAGENAILLDSYTDGVNLIAAVASKPELVKGEWLYKNLQVVELRNSKVLQRRSVLSTTFHQANFTTSHPVGLQITVDDFVIQLD